MVGKILISHRVTRKLIKLTKILTEDKIIVEFNPEFAVAIYCGLTGL